MSQISSIKNHLNSGRTITPLEALDLYGCFRLAAVIFILKNEHGMNIKTEEKTRTNGSGVSKRFAEYRCVSPEGDKEQINMFSDDPKKFKKWLDEPPKLNEKKHIR